MPRTLVVEFTKMHGAGNDFLVLDNRFFHFSDDELADLARRYCPRRTGVGADGLLALSVPSDPDRFAYRMRYRNADGSLARMCGNGARCLARFAQRAGLGSGTLRFESDAGPYRAEVPEDPEADVRLHVPDPRDFDPACDLTASADAGLGPLAFVWTGTEHLVAFVDDLDAVALEAIAPPLRRAAELEAVGGANVNVVAVEGADRLRVRTFEKGVEAETQACGTGALAAAVTARLTGRTGADRIAVAMPGGTLHVGLRVEDGGARGVYLEGPAATVFRGTVEIAV